MAKKPRVKRNTLEPKMELGTIKIPVFEHFIEHITNTLKLKNIMEISKGG